MASVATTEFSRQMSPLLKAKPNAIQELHVPKLRYLMIDGTGAPSSEAYSKAIQGLYGLAYTIKFLPKAGVNVPGYEPFSVAPLEGLYGKFEEGWNWTLMIPMPSFVTEETLQLARAEMLRREKDVNESVRLEDWEEGDVIQTLHVGPYSEEQPTIDRLHTYASSHSYELVGRHNEIYMNDPRRVAPDKIKVIIRNRVKKRA